MVRILHCLRRLPLLSAAEFERHFEAHCSLLRVQGRALGFRRVVAVSTLEDGVNAAMRTWVTGGEPYDAVLELWIDSIDTLVTSIVDGPGRQAADLLVGSLGPFVDLPASPMWATKERLLYDS